MIEEFINGELYIKITKEDMPYLGKLQEKTGLRWNSGDDLDSQVTLNYFNTFFKNKTIYIANYGPYGIQFTYRASQVNKWVTLSQVLSENTKYLEVSENDVLNILE